MRGWTTSSGRPFPEPCLCGATDCPKCYPGCDRESDDEEEQEIEPDDPPEPSEDDLDRAANEAEGAYTKRILG
jgi:hypothetical protein